MAVLGTDAKIYVPTPPAGGTGADEVAIQSVYPSLPSLELWVDPNASAGSPLAQHSALQGLDHDDHLQYLTEARGDSRFIKRAGDGMLGPLTVQPPSLSDHAARLLDANAYRLRSIVSGNGLVGGGDLSTDRTLAVGAGTGLAVSADEVYVNRAVTDSWYVLKGSGATSLIVSAAAASGTAAAGTVWIQY